MLISYCDSEFLSKHIGQVYEQNDMIHNVMHTGDHHSQGIIDRFPL